MGIYNSDFVLDDLTEAFNRKRIALGEYLRLCGWTCNVSWLDDHHPDISDFVQGISSSATKRREFDEQQYLSTFDEPTNIVATIDENIFLAAVHWRLGLLQFETGRREAFGLLLKSIELLDVCRGITEHEMWVQDEAKIAALSLEGGKAKAARFDGIKAEIIRLLLDKRPVEGWPAKTTAIRALESDICKFIDQHGWPSSTDRHNNHKDSAELYANIERQILDWSRSDSQVRAAFSEAVLRSKRNVVK